MNRQNPIIEDYKLLLVFRNIGLKLLLQLKAVMTGQSYNSFFKDVTITEHNELIFSYLNHTFKTQVEIYFSITKMPKSALLTTYLLKQEKEPAEIVSYAFDLEFTVNDTYTLEDFAEYYLIEFHQNIKKSFSENHEPFQIRLNSK